MPQIYKYFIFSVFLIGSSNAVTCSVGYDTLYVGGYCEYNYTGDVSTRWMNDLYISNDGSSIYTIELDSSAGGNNCYISRRDQTLQQVWYVAHDYTGYNFEFNSAETALYLSINPGICTLNSISTTDGSVNWSKAFSTEIGTGEDIALSNDEYIYFIDMLELFVMFSISSQSIYYAGTTSGVSSTLRIGYQSGSINYGLISTYTYTNTYNRIGISAMNLTDVVWAYGLDCQNLCTGQTATAYVDETNSAVVIATTVNSNGFIFQLSSDTGALQSSLMESTSSYSSLTWGGIFELELYDSNVFIYYEHIVGYVAFRYSTTNLAVVEGFSDSSSPSYKFMSFDGGTNGFIYSGITATYTQLYKIYYLDDDQRGQLLTGSEGVSVASGYTLEDITASYVFSSFAGSTSVGDSGITLNTTATYNKIAESLYDVIYDGGYSTTMTAAGGSVSNISYTYFCSAAGSTVITESINDLAGLTAVSSWITINADYLTLSVNPPSVTINTDYEFSISYTVNSLDIFQIGTITVSPSGSVSNCLTCSSDDSNVGTECEANYILSGSGSSGIQKSVEVEALIATSITVAVVSTSTAVVSSLTSTMGAGSPQSTWAILNQYQLIILLPMLGTYLENDFKYYVYEFQFASGNFEYISFISFPALDKEIDNLDFTQSSQLFADNAIESGSYLVNHYQFFKLLIIFFMIHFGVIVSYFIFIHKLKVKSKYLLKFMNWSWSLYHYTMYVRVTVEAMLFMFIGSMLEISQKSSVEGHPFSYTCAFIAMIALWAIVIIIPGHYFKYRNENEINTKYFSEIYDGTKDTVWAKLYVFFFLLRRGSTAFILVAFRSTELYLRCSLFVIVQALSGLYSLIVKPFDNPKDNLIEGLNEIIFLLFSIILTIFSKESLWLPSLSFILITVLMINGFIIGGIILIDMIINWLKKGKSKCAGKSKSDLNDSNIKSKATLTNRIFKISPIEDIHIDDISHQSYIEDGPKTERPQNGKDNKSYDDISGFIHIDQTEIKLKPYSIEETKAELSPNNIESIFDDQK